ncbi:MAG: Mur ligase family protein [Bacteroidales bacterium]|nr:Mur ligase family protein [Bacteroidales bacterium]
MAGTGTSKERVHFIAIGGAVMHNLAIALHQKGCLVTGSDDEIFEPAASRLASYGLLPPQKGWFPEKITPETGRVILGMHAREDNAELQRARELGITINSFPEYLYEQTRNKRRIVVGGSHGKTTTTAMIMHVLKYNGIKFDYMVGSAIGGYNTMVSLDSDSEIAVFEGDEYLSSALDRRPKFHLYHPDIAIINGIAWDHMNVFPTREDYLSQFSTFAGLITRGGSLACYDGDPNAVAIAENARRDITKILYGVHPYIIRSDGWYALYGDSTVKVPFFGNHNFQNLSAAREACLAAGLAPDQFYAAIPTFPGTARRLQKLCSDENSVVFLDFAHAPSKVRATIEAVAAAYSGWNIAAVLELHTYSSLNAGFIGQYDGTMDAAGKAYVYFNPHALEIKKLPAITCNDVVLAFNHNNLFVTSNSGELKKALAAASAGAKKTVWLFMSSGDFDCLDIKNLIKT